MPGSRQGGLVGSWNSGTSNLKELQAEAKKKADNAKKAWQLLETCGLAWK